MVLNWFSMLCCSPMIDSSLRWNSAFTTESMALYLSLISSLSYLDFSMIILSLMSIWYLTSSICLFLSSCSKRSLFTRSVILSSSLPPKSTCIQPITFLNSSLFFKFEISRPPTFCYSRSSSFLRAACPCSILRILFSSLSTNSAIMVVLFSPFLSNKAPFYSPYCTL